MGVGGADAPDPIGSQVGGRAAPVPPLDAAARELRPDARPFDVAPRAGLLTTPPPRSEPEVGPAGVYAPRNALRRALGATFAGSCFLATVFGVVALAVLLYDVLASGGPHVSLDFVRGYPSRFPERAGIWPALLGTLWVLVLTAVFTFPVGVATAVWLEEYAPRNRLTQIVQINIANLAGVPAIVYGILGLALFVRALALGRSVLAGGLTLGLLVLPVVIIAAQEAIRAVPDSLRQGAYALGATRWQVVRGQVLPMALPGILTGTILALSRAIGEASPLIVMGALAFVPFAPKGLGDPFTVLPIQIFNWISRPQTEFHARAAAAILVLLAVLLTLNTVAILLRNHYAKKLK